MGRKKFSEAQILFIKEKYPRFGATFCAEQLGLSPQQVRKIAQYRGIKVSSETKEKLLLNRCSDNTRNVPVQQFIGIKAPEIAYILGILWAECWLAEPQYGIRMCIVERDFYNIEYLFDATGKWNKQYRERENKKPSVTISTYSKQLFDLFNELGMYPHSTESACKTIEIVPQKLRHIWWAGYFDGDGCIYVPQRQLVFASSIEQNWDFLNNLCESFKINYSIRNQKSKSGWASYFRITNIDGIKRFGHFIYKDGCFGFERKFLLFNKICELNRFRIISPTG